METNKNPKCLNLIYDFQFFANKGILPTLKTKSAKKVIDGALKMQRRAKLIDYQNLVFKTTFSCDITFHAKVILNWCLSTCLMLL